MCTKEEVAFRDITINAIFSIMSVGKGGVTYWTLKVVDQNYAGRARCHGCASLGGI
jgi:hypothetical protein